MNLHSARHQVRSLIASLGGREAVADLTDAAYATVRSWEHQGFIPAEKYDVLDKVGASRGVSVLRSCFRFNPAAAPSQIVGALPKKIKAAAKT